LAGTGWKIGPLVNVSDLKELHYIIAIANLPSILKLGILSNAEVSRKRVTSVSIALQGVQERRESKVIPGAKPVHEYVNLYICARNPMMYLRSSHHLDLCVLRISATVLNLADVIIADGNAASDYTSFWPSPSGLGKIDKNAVFAEWWTDPDQITQWQNKRVKCAEVLVPNRLDQKYIFGAYVSCQQAADKVSQLASGLPTTIDPHLFFR
jgi:ssDNA thymidine ADP-ribosyltransferase, DarT